MNDYEDLLQYATNLLKGHSTLIEPSDLVADAYIELHDSDRKFHQDYKNKIKSLFYHQTKYQSGENERLPSHITDLTCTICKETLPVGMFRLYRKKGSGDYNAIRNQCRPCERNIVAEWRDSNPQKWAESRKRYESTSKAKELNKKRVSKFVDANREKWNAYLRERYRLAKIKKEASKNRTSDNELMVRKNK